MLIKNYLVSQIAEVATPNSECVMLKLKCLPHLMIMACYIAPSDSQYHSFAPLAEMQNRMKMQPRDKYLIIGDMNARFGSSRHAFLEGKRLPDGTRYRTSPDTTSQPNSNARYLMNSLKENCILLNSLSSHEVEMSGDLTFRQAQTWISELDTCYISPEYLPAVTEFTVHQLLNLPSDHAPISVCLSVDKAKAIEETIIDGVIERAAHLGQSVADEEPTERSIPCRKTIRFNEIDETTAKDTLRNMQPPSLEFPDVNRTADVINNMLYTCAWNAKRSEQTVQEPEQQKHSTSEVEQIAGGE